jgi:hypothetical protein
MRSVLGVLKQEGTTASMDDALTSFKERDQIVALDEWQQLERRFLTKDES